MDKIEELLTRGVDKVYPTKAELENILRSGKKLTIYQGFDPTGTQLHIGHMMGLRKLRQWQDLGHEVIFLIGDFTGMIGDPSGKTSVRKVLTREKVLANAKTYKEQASKILRFTGENPVKVKFNGDWLGKMSAIEFLQIARLLSVNQVIERDMFQQRQKQGEDVYMNEFLYPVMQAYDSVAMKVDVEIGGTDQMFNMLMGRKLMRHILHKDKFVMTTPLLTDSEGRKIGKTEGNVIALNDSPNDFYSKLMALGDDVIVKCFEYLTDVTMDKVKYIEKELKAGKNPIPFKKQLAFEITSGLNGKKAAEEAQIYYEKKSENKNDLSWLTMQSLPTIKLSEAAQTSTATIANLTEQLINAGTISSKSDLRRIIDQGGAALITERANKLEEEKIKSVDTLIPSNKTSFIKLGSRKPVKIIGE